MCARDYRTHLLNNHCLTHKELAIEKAGSTLRSSRAVPHPSTNRALRRLASEVGRDPVHSTRYGRQRTPFPCAQTQTQSPTHTHTHTHTHTYTHIQTHSHTQLERDRTNKREVERGKATHTNTQTPHTHDGPGFYCAVRPPGSPRDAGWGWAGGRGAEAYIHEPRVRFPGAPPGASDVLSTCLCVFCLFVSVPTCASLCLSVSASVCVIIPKYEYGLSCITYLL